MTVAATAAFPDLAGRFLARFGLESPAPGDPRYLRELYRAFGDLPYENLSKIIRKHQADEDGQSRFRTPEQVLEGFLESRLGGTCFSLTQTLFALLRHCGFRAYRVLGDMRHGENIHCAVVTVLEREKYLLDAGYLLPEPVLLSPAGRTILRGALYEYHLMPEADGAAYSLFTRSHGTEELKWRYRLHDRAADDRAFAHWWDRSFEAAMMGQLVLTRAFEGGQAYLHQQRLRLNLPDGRRNLNLRDELPERVRELFGIDPALTEAALGRLERERAARGRTR